MNVWVGTAFFSFFSFQINSVLISCQYGLKMMITGLSYPAVNGKFTGSFQACFRIFDAQTQD